MAKCSLVLFRLHRWMLYSGWWLPDKTWQYFLLLKIISIGIIFLYRKFIFFLSPHQKVPRFGIQCCNMKNPIQTGNWGECNFLQLNLMKSDWRIKYSPIPNTRNQIHFNWTIFLLIKIQTTTGTLASSADWQENGLICSLNE